MSNNQDITEKAIHKNPTMQTIKNLQKFFLALKKNIGYNLKQYRPKETKSQHHK